MSINSDFTNEKLAAATDHGWLNSCLRRHVQSGRTRPLSNTITPPRNSSRTGRPFNSGRRHRANFARQATIDAFGWRFAKTLDEANFVDRLPSQFPRPAPEARFE